MSRSLDGILALAADSDDVTATLSPGSYAVILFALSNVRNRTAWLDGFDDFISNADWAEIVALLDDAENELLSGTEA